MAIMESRFIMYELRKKRQCTFLSLYVFSVGYKSAGFLAYLSYDLIGLASFTAIPFDTKVYDYGNNYNDATGRDENNLLQKKI